MQDKFLDRRVGGWASDSAAVCGVVPFGGDELAVPGEQRGWGDREGVAPSASRYEARQCGEPEAIGCFGADGAGEVAAQDRVLVPRHEQFGVFGTVAAQQHCRDGQQPSRQLVQQRHDHQVMISEATPSGVT